MISLTKINADGTTCLISIPAGKIDRIEENNTVIPLFTAGQPDEIRVGCAVINNGIEIYVLQSRSWLCKELETKGIV